MQIQATPFLGESILNVEENWTVAANNEDLQQPEGISVPQQRFLYRGKNLADQTTMEITHVQARDAIRLVPVLRAVWEINKVEQIA
jgi:hypothetical protein